MKPILAFVLACSMLAGQTPAPAAAPAAAPAPVEKKMVKKKGGKGKWIVIGAVAAVAVVTVVVLNTRLGNEGKGIF